MPRLYLVELYAGTRSISRAVLRSSIGRAFDVRLLSVDKDPKFEPTVCVDINKWDFRADTEQFLSDRMRSDVVVVHASPPCTEFSIALTSRPRDLRAGSRNVRRALKIITHAKPSFWFLENPATGLLKDQPFTRKSAPYKHETCYCKWGLQCKKPTNIWSNVEGLDLPMCTSQAPCRIKREFGKHLVTAQTGDSKSGAVGSGGGENVYGLPPKLVRYLFKAGVATVRAR